MRTAINDVRKIYKKFFTRLFHSVAKIAALLMLLVNFNTRHPRRNVEVSIYLFVEIEKMYTVTS
jgi:hypothetical protein